MPNGFLDPAFRRGQTLFAEVNAVAPPKGLGGVHVDAAVVNEVTFRGIRDPCLRQSLGGRQNLRPTDNAGKSYLVVIISLRFA